MAIEQGGFKIRLVSSPQRRFSLAYGTGRSVAVSSLSVAAHGADLTGTEVDATIDADSLPAVSEINGKLGVFGAWNDHDFLNDDATYYGVSGAVSLPISHAWGIQFDATTMITDGDFSGTFGTHLFWRDPSQGLIGGYAAYTSDNSNDTSSWRIAAEAEGYFDRVTVAGLAGWESIDLPSPFSDEDNFFGIAKLNYYINDDFVAGVGVRREGDANFFTASAEYQFTSHEGRGISAFAEGRFGEDDARFIVGGLKMYFGSDKSLISRHREDDPDVYDWLTAGSSALGNACKGWAKSSGKKGERGYYGKYKGTENCKFPGEFFPD